MKEVPLTNGAFTLVDDEDFERVIAYRWYPNQPLSKTYAVGQVPIPGMSRSGIYGMHRFILGLTPDDPHVDHINGLPLDNRKKNLRLATPQQNAWNKRPDRGIRYKGVGRRGDKFRIRIRHGDRFLWLGTYSDEMEAVQMYDAAARLLRGEYAWTNIPYTPPEYIERMRAVLASKGVEIPADDMQEVA